MPSSTQVDVQLPPDIIYDPENGTISFELQQYVAGSSQLQPLPLFLTFDSNNLRMSGSPQASDVGMYALVLVGTSSWGPRKGNATTLLLLTVQQSWGDFFAWVYSIVGSIASALGVVTWCLVYRAQITNILMFSRRLRKSPPTALCTLGRYTLRYANVAPGGDGDDKMMNEALGEPIPANRIKAVRATLVGNPRTPADATAGPGIFTSRYLDLQQRLSDTKVKMDLITGVQWLQLSPTRLNTIELVVDVPTLQHLVATGKVMLADEYYVEVTTTGRWSSGTIVEAFTFHVDLLLGGRKGLVDEVDEQSAATAAKLSLQLKSLTKRLLEAETQATQRDTRLAEAEAMAKQHAVELSCLRQELRGRDRQDDGKGALRIGERTGRLDPYTGQPILMLLEEDQGDETGSSDESDSSSEPPPPVDGSDTSSDDNQETDTPYSAHADL